MDFSDSPDSRTDALSIVEPVYVASYGKSTSPFYQIDQRQLLLSDALHQPHYRATYPASFSNSTNFIDPFISIYQLNSSIHQLSASSPSVYLNSPPSVYSKASLNSSPREYSSVSLNAPSIGYSSSSPSVSPSVSPSTPQNSSPSAPQSASPSTQLNSPEDESLNESTLHLGQLNRRQSEAKKPFLQVLSDNFNQKISKSLSSIRSVYNSTSRRLSTLKQLKQLDDREKLDDERAAGDKSGTLHSTLTGTLTSTLSGTLSGTLGSTLNRITSRLGKLVSLPKRRNGAQQTTVDSNSNVNIFEHSSDMSGHPVVQSLGRPFGESIGQSFEQSLEQTVGRSSTQSLKKLDGSSSEQANIPATARDRARPFKETYKALFKLNPLSADMDKELNRIHSLARFVERSLRIIGLEPIYQLLSFNSSRTDENLQKLVNQINSKLVQNGEFQRMFGHLVPGSMNRFKANDPVDTIRKSSDANRRSSDSTDDLHQFELPNVGGGPERRSSDDEDDFNESDLLLELEEYVRSKRSTTSSKRRRASRKSSKQNESDHDERISELNESDSESTIKRTSKSVSKSKRNEGGDLRREDNVEKEKPPIEKRASLSSLKSRKRRSKKLGLKSKKNRKKSARSVKGLKSKLKKARKTSKKKKKSKGYNQSFPACDSSSESCKESEIHERYVPFVNTEGDGAQASESYGAQPTSEENGGQSGQYGESGNEYARNEYTSNEYNRHQEDNYQQSDRPYEPATNSYRQDDEFRPEAGRLKSSVKYEGQANYQQNYQQNNQANYGADQVTGGQSSYGQLAEDTYKQPANDDYEYPAKGVYDGGYSNNPFETSDGWSYTTARKPFRSYLAPDYLYETSSWSHKPTPEPHDTKSLLKSLIDLKLKKKFPTPPPPKSIAVYHHLNPHYDDEDHWELDEHHHHHPEPTHEPHEKDELTLVKELITNLLMENKHKILKILKLSKISHLLVGKQLLAATLKILFGKGLIAKKHLIIVAYKKCYIKIKTVDLLLIPGK